MTEALRTWRAGTAKQAIVDFVSGVRRRTGPCPSRSASPSSTTTARCGARSRCRSSSTSSSAGSSRWREARPDAARAPAVEGGVRARLRLVRRRHDRALRRRRHERAGRWPAASSRPTTGSASRTSRRRPTRSSAARSTRPSAAATSSARTHRWSSCSSTSRRTGSRTTSSSGGGRDFMRPISQEVYGIPRERVIGSSSDARLHAATSAAGRSRTRPSPTISTTAPRSRSASGAAPAAGPLVAAGNSNGDVPMLDFTQHQDKPSLRLLVLHDDAEREFDYTAGAEQALERAGERLDRRQRQERLGDRLLVVQQVVARDTGVPRSSSSALCQGQS